jgi:hypothetical protein
MGEAAIASGSSIASLGLGAFSSVLKGYGTQAADEMQADRARRAAEFGKLQAELTDTQFRERLNTTLSNIEVIRSAARIDPTSPTTAALEDFETMKSERQRTVAGLNIRSQIDEDEASADYLRRAGSFALGMGYFDAFTKIAGAVGKGLTAPGGGGYRGVGLPPGMATGGLY